MMCHTMKKLGEAELEIMQAVWRAGHPVTSSYILKQLQDSRQWKLSTLMTSLSRLSKKGFLNCDRSEGCNLYTFAISENEYCSREGRHFLEKLYHNSIQNMVATLYNSRELKEEDLRELREFLDRVQEEGQ